MQAFAQDGRVQRKEDGIYFYEQDILYSPYLFSGNITIDVTTEFARPGFGIVIAEDNEKTFRDATHRYLFDVGAYEFNVYEKHNMTQAQSVNVSSTLNPERGKEIRFRFVLEHYTMKAYILFKDTETKKDAEELLGTYKFGRKFHNYRVGIYSEKGNTVKDVAFLQDIPTHWDVNSKNIRGGRIRFIEDGFLFERCLNDAEIEQDNIPLKAGTYYLRYNTEPVDDKMDIQCFIFPSQPKTSEKTGGPSDNSMEDDKKNILDYKTKSFTILEDGEFDIKFKGTSGKIFRISLMDNEHSDFVKTDDEPAASKGSSVVINTTGVKTITWEGIIYDYPDWLDMKEECPYAIVATSIERLNKNSFPVPMNELLKYEYNIPGRMMSAYTEKGTPVVNYRIRHNPNYPTFTIFENIRGAISNLVLTYENGATMNVNIQKTYKTYVPATIVGPIIATNAGGESYDLSSSYREVVDPEYRIDIFSADKKEFLLNYHMTDVMAKPEVYGVPAGYPINKWADTIQGISDHCKKIDAPNVDVKDHKVIIPESIRKYFAYIVVRYQGTEKFMYQFTNYEREIFDDESYIVLDKIPSAAGSSIFIYGIPEDSKIYDEYFYRVPDKGALNTIDLCVDHYDIIKGDQYVVNTGTGEITLDKSLKGKYKNYIIDYLKSDSYCINYNEQLGQYEVDISSESPVMRIHYEMEKNTMESSGLIRTKIKPNKNKFIVLKRKEGAFIED